MRRLGTKKTIGIGVGIGIIVLGIIILTTHTHSDVAPTAAPKDFIGNRGSSEQTPTAAGSSFVGYENLVNTAGFTTDQIDSIQAAFQKYKPTSTAGTVIDISTSALTPYSPDANDPLYRPSIGASVTVNQKTTYKVKIYFWGTGSIELLLYDTSGKTQLFDSGAVTSGN